MPFETIFREMDADQDGKLNKSETFEALAKLKLAEISDTEFTEVDTDKDGMITLEEFLTLANSRTAL